MDDFVFFINARCGTNRDEQGQLTSKVSLKYMFSIIRD